MQDLAGRLTVDRVEEPCFVDVVGGINLAKVQWLGTAVGAKEREQNEQGRDQPGGVSGQHCFMLRPVALVGWRDLQAMMLFFPTSTGPKLLP